MRHRRVKSLLAIEYMSSESSAEETDVDNDALKVRPLPFLRKKYHRMFDQLDTFAIHKASKRGMHQRKTRVKSTGLAQEQYLWTFLSGLCVLTTISWIARDCYYLMGHCHNNSEMKLTLNITYCLLLKCYCEKTF